jgi:hypothetical protein
LHADQAAARRGLDLHGIELLLNLLLEVLRLLEKLEELHAVKS